MKKQIQGAKYWSDLAQWWRKVAPPVRPSKSDVKIYERFLKRAIKNKKQSKILILGATPEMRDLAAKYRAETTICDISLEMIMAMIQLMVYKKASQKEVWIKASWVTVPLQHNYYDVILADGVVCNIPWPEVNQWWKHLTQLLKPKGVFITRAFCFTSRNEIDKSLNNLIKKVLKKRNPLATDFGQLKIILEIASYNSKTRTGSNAKYRELFFKHIENFSVSQTKANKIYHQLVKIYPLKPVKVWRIPTRAQREKEIKKYFKVIVSIPSPSFPTIPTIYLLKKK